jgi:hypothetical protein
VSKRGFRAVGGIGGKVAVSSNFRLNKIRKANIIVPFQKAGFRLTPGVKKRRKAEDWNLEFEILD